MKSKKLKIQYSHVIPPHLFKGRDGIMYLVPLWVPVPDNTTLNDIEWINPYSRKRELIKRVKSSRGNIYYNIVAIGKEITCDCPGAKYRNRNCKHIQALPYNIKQKYESNSLHTV